MKRGGDPNNTWWICEARQMIHTPLPTHSHDKDNMCNHVVTLALHSRPKEIAQWCRCLPDWRHTLCTALTPQSVQPRSSLQQDSCPATKKCRCLNLVTLCASACLNRKTPQCYDGTGLGGRWLSAAGDGPAQPYWLTRPSVRRNMSPLLRKRTRSVAIKWQGDQHSETHWTTYYSGRRQWCWYSSWCRR